jgi:hypothetical protein
MEKEMTKEEMAQKILFVLERGSFYRWYARTFEDYLKADEGAPSKEKILKDIINLFGLVD